MSTLVFILKAFNASIQFLTGAVVLSYQGKKHTLEDDKFFTHWQTVEGHFCNSYEQLMKTPWSEFIPLATLREAAGQAAGEPYIFDLIDDVSKLIAESAEETRAQFNTPKQKMLIEDFLDKGEKPEVLVGYDSLVFPNANVAKRYFFSYARNLPEGADWKEGEARIVLSDDPSEGIKAMIKLIENIIEEHSWATIDDREPPASPGLPIPQPVCPAGQEPDQHHPAVDLSETPEDKEGRDYTMAQAMKDLIERWEEDINTSEYKLFLRSGLVVGDHMGKQLSGTIWRALPEKATVEEFLREAAAAIKSNEQKFKTCCETRIGLRGAVTMVLARKAQLDLSGGVLTKK